MFLTKFIKSILITAIFIITYLPITINPKTFERNPRDSMSYYIELDNIVSAIDY